MNAPRFAVSLMCMDFANVAEQISALNKHADSFHLDVMDGHFAPNLALSPDWISAIVPYTKIRTEVHLMADEPERWIEPLAHAGVDIISPHVETIHNDAFRIMNRIKENGCRTGLVLNPLTPFEEVKLLLPRVDLLTFMSVDIGFAGQSFIDEVLPKIRQAVEFREREGLNYEIQIDGHCFEGTYKKVRESGADTFIVGNAGLFNLSKDVDEAWSLMLDTYERATGEKVDRK
ncbi:D-allulose 6-phosphate 3-epimerase [Bifidobacterium sp. ESL0732]|uniref:D-allulose 6-phosphate 3-epimerase n=1 Tax=Bifidobacterium sp. ESL0732 TaxID=2983222 RepID=UPI0023F82A24|nr:D-allulose 6-phosphate 3-epimerase [Bifidobacterium sp. ESL0732]WEV64727.1 D-allulose 6-phosphate 3-epimerase [Bifidobacterium sp. ESL0732]